MQLKRILFPIAGLLLYSVLSFGQDVTIHGKITDANSGDPIPFVNVFYPGTSVGTTTNFEGYYELRANYRADSLSASYIGYNTRTKSITQEARSFVMNFQLEESIMNLEEVVVHAGENPAYPILRKVMDHKKVNDKRKLDAYQYETYTKIEIDVDNISEQFRQKKIMQKITQVMDSVEQIAGEDGKPILPIFISESLSNFYFRSSPKMQKEKILKTRITGVGIEDGTLVSQFIGSSFQEYNFYNNWLNIVAKEFVSPIADGWKLYYEYDLIDSAFVGDDFCYRLDFYPRSEQDLAFTGSMWITTKEFALRQIDATVSPTVNLNYIEKIKIQQELARTEAGAWIPVKNRVLLDIGEISDNMAGMLAKFYTSNTNIEVNQPQEVNFYAKPIEVAEDFKMGTDENFWNNHRHEPLTPTEVNVYQMIDTLKNIPVVRTYTDIIKVAIGGYYTVGKFDVGPYLALYANNSVEGSRFYFGGRTNISFSDKWILGGYAAYGTRDSEWKYSAFAERIFNRDRWTTLRLQHSHDIDQVGLEAQQLQNNYIFLAATRFGDLNRPYYFSQTSLTFEREVLHGITPSISVRHRSYDPLFDFAYYTDNEQSTDLVATDFDITEAYVQAKFAKDELFVQNDNDRISLGTLKWPILTLRYTRGIENFLGGDFSYNRIGANILHDLNLGILGTSTLSLTAEKTFESLPYPLLSNHVGNESVFYTSAAYNLMNYSEFVSDEYVSFRYNHYFQGFLLNRVPLLKKLKWRLLASANVLYGRLSEENRQLLPELTMDGQPTAPIYGLDNRPYIELGYGVENIFKVLRVDFFHRLTYLDNPDARKFGVKISFQVIL